MNPALTTRKLTASLSWEAAGIAALLLAGAVLRVRQYLTGRSLWVDEAMLALNIVEREFAGMFQPLDYDQGAPIGFLLVEKVFHLVLGRGELALRLFPLLVGLLSLGLFYLLLRRVTSTAGLLTALALFAFNPRLIYYSSEVKQYILDAAVAILLLWLAAPVLDASPRRKGLAVLAVAGLIALWFSHPALFVLAGIGLALVLLALQRRDLSSLWLTLAMGVLWLLELGLLYVLILGDLSRNDYMREYWQGAFLPMPLWSDPAWFGRALDQNIGVQFGIPYAVFFVFVLMLIGWVMLFLQHRGFALAVACTALVTLLASAWQLYPVFERMILFLVPVGLVLLGKAVEALYRSLQKYRFAGVIPALVLAGFLLYGPVVTSVQSFIEPKYFEHIRPTMEHLRDSWKEGDVLYISSGALPAFRYYAPVYGLGSIPYVFGSREDYRDPQNMVSQLATLEGQPRVWTLFSHVYERGDFNEREFLLKALDQMGRQRREFRVPGTSVFLYLYDLRD